MNDKGFALNIVLFLAVFVIGIFILLSFLDKGPGKLSDSVKSSPSSSPITSTTSRPEDECSPKFKDEIFLKKHDNENFLIDQKAGYELNMTTLPQMSLALPPSCPASYYEADMYDLRQEPSIGSVARFSFIGPPVVNSDNLSLREYAKQESKYVEGTHTENGNNYDQPFYSSPIEEISLPEGYQGIGWENIYTEEERYHEGTTASKTYLLEKDNKIYTFNVFAWDIPTFKKSTREFDVIAKTFRVIDL